MSIPVVCPSCSARLKAPDRAAGGKMTCPKCDEPVQVPHPDRAGFSERGRGKPKLSDDSFDDTLPTPPSISRTGVTMLIVGGCVAVLGLILTTLVVARYIWAPAPAPVIPLPVATQQVAQPVKPADNPPGEPIFVDATKGPVKCGDFDVRVLQVEFKKVPIVQLLGEDGTSAQELLIVWVGVHNLSPTRKLDYTGWAPGGGLAPGGLAGGGGIVPKNLTPATLKDDLGNVYHPATLEAGATVKDQKYRESIHPNQKLTDILIFEPPVAKASALLLELPLKVLGSFDSVRFRIPTNRINKPLYDPQR